MKTAAKTVLALASLAAVLTLGACMGPDGQPYLYFDWVTSPSYYFYTDVPGIPALVYPLHEYPVMEGTWYCEYQHDFSSPRRWITFAITAHKGEPFMTQGEDSLFELFLWKTTPPQLTQWYSLGGDHADPTEPVALREPIDQPAYRTVTEGTMTQDSGSYRLVATYGRYEAQ
jgi:hypothetical protein